MCKVISMEAVINRRIYFFRAAGLSAFIFLLLFASPTHAAVRANISFTALNLNPGLVGWWTFDGKDMVQNVVDKSGSGNTGRLVGFTSTTTAGGMIGQALTFNGTSNRIQTGNTSPTASFSVSFWMKPGDWRDFGQMVNQWDETGNQRSWDVAQFADGKIYAYHSVGGGTFDSPYIASNATVPLGKWTHVLVVYDTNGGGTGKRIYINGALDNSGSYTTAYTVSQPVYIGYSPRFGDQNDQYFKGLIDDVRIYNRALSATEIAQFYRASQGTRTSATTRIPNLQSGLVGHWSFDGKDMTQNVADKSGSGNTGRLVGFTSTSTALGKIGQALKFDGSDDRTTVTDNSSFDLRTNDVVSVFAWVKRSSEQANAGVVWDNRSYFLQTASGKFRFGHFKSDDVNFYSVDVNTPRASDGKWHFIGQTFNGSVTTLYVDGVVATDVTVVNGTDGSGLGYGNADHNGYLGQTPTFANSAFGGLIDDVRLYNRVLSAAEVAQLYKLGEPVHVNTSLNQPNLKSGLAGHWTFDGRDMTQNVKDASGSSNHGFLTGFTSTTTVAGKMGQALSFDGSNDYITHGDPTTFDGPTAQTITAWVNTNSFSIQRAIVTKWDAAPAQQVWGNYLNTTGSLGYCVYHHTDWRNGSICITSNQVLVINTWYHVASVWQASGNTMVLYINGVADAATPTVSGSAPTSLSNNTSPLRIGNFRESGGANVKHFSGKMDDVRIYNRALSATEVKQLYKLGI